MPNNDTACDEGGLSRGPINILIEAWSASGGERLAASRDLGREILHTTTCWKQFHRSSDRSSDEYTIAIMIPRWWWWCIKSLFR